MQNLANPFGKEWLALDYKYCRDHFPKITIFFSHIGVVVKRFI